MNKRYITFASLSVAAPCRWFGDGRVSGLMAPGIVRPGGDVKKIEADRPNKKRNVDNPERSGGLSAFPG